MALVHGLFSGAGVVERLLKYTVRHLPAFQTQCCPPPSHRQDEVQGDELAGIRSRSSPAGQPDAVDDRGSFVVVEGAEADDARRPAALFRSGNRDRPDVRLGVRSAAAPDGGAC